MKFGAVPVAEAAGAVLAHSLALPNRKLRKGRVLAVSDIEDLTAAGVTEVIVARQEPGEMAEDAAAATLAEAILTDGCGLAADAPFTGRVNLRALGPGILEVDRAAIDRINAVDPAITIATLPEWQRVTAGMMVTTVKIIPYAASSSAVEAAVAVAPGALFLRRPQLKSAGLIVTEIGSTGAADKGIAATENRLSALDVSLASVETVPHNADAIADALGRIQCDLALILTASATSDANDVGPAGLTQAGGTLTRFGMPVDPGNLLFLGDQAGRPVIGLPGCARSPALNGADWVMERVICGAPPKSEDIAAMGVGGLLKEIPTRPQPRERQRK